jgi:predicted PurR-regulated permease PerM
VRIYEGLLVLPNLRQNGIRALTVAMFVAIALPPSHAICERLASSPRPVVACTLALAFVAVLVALGSPENYEFYYFQF